MAIGYDRTGAGAPLLLIHGLGGDRHVWAPVVQRLAGERDVVCVDLPGFGESDALAEDQSPPALARALRAFMYDELGWERADVAGNSLGAWTALEIARLGSARSVTAIAPAGFWSRTLGPKPMVMRTVSRALLPILPVLLRNDGIRRFGLAASVAHPERVPLDAAIQMAKAYAGSKGFADVNRAMRSNRFLDGEQITDPVTLAWCEHDRLVVRPREPLIPGAHEVVLRDCGHVPMYDDPDAVARVVREGSAHGAARAA